ncbi:MAG: hypothetical protein RLZZ116_534 [Planctomycetota bacterium]|jgi:sialate O-acetylesterase
MASIISVFPRVSVAVLGSILATQASGAELALDTLFQNHAVLQRDRAIPVRGTATAGAKVRVEFGGASAEGTAGADGRFSVSLPPMGASLEPREMVVRAGADEVRVKDVLVGEVWFCSGQSNMEWTVDGADDADRAKSIAAKSVPIRSFKAPHVTANEPRARVPGTWRIASPETVGGFTAVGWWFGVDLARSFSMEVPIGLVDISWGGTRIEPWIPLDEMAKSDFKDRAESLQKAIDASRAVKPEDRARAQAEEDARYAKELDGYWLKALANEQGQKESWAKSDGAGSEWRSAQLPAYYPGLDPALGGFDGFVWFTREFEVGAGMAGKPLTLALPAIDDCDIVWIDGAMVGATINNWTQPRNYAIAKGLSAGKHRLSACVLDMAGQGGFANGAMKLSDAGGGTIDLAGEWKWRKGGGVPQVAAPMRRDLNRQPGTEPHEPAAIYNAMMAPCISYPVRGAIWYQGESNAGEPDAYRKLLPLLMNSWRAKSGNPDMAWGIVQLAAFMPFVESEPAQGGWALLREAQFRGAADGKGGMISATDLGDAGDIHPRRKREVGERLGAWARSTVYGEASAAWKGPELSATKRDGAKVVCSFAQANGLAASDAKALGGFAVAGADGKFVWADARVDGNTVIVEASGVQDPVEVAYAWQNNPVRANLVNGVGLPAIPFRVKIAK